MVAHEQFWWKLYIAESGKEFTNLTTREIKLSGANEYREIHFILFSCSADHEEEDWQPHQV